MDGVQYPGIVINNLKRGFQVLDGPNTDRVMTGGIVRDIIGTYYNYTMEVDPSNSAPEVYDAFYEVISAPVRSHMITVLYGYQGTMTYEAYVTAGEDSVFTAADGRTVWDGLSIQFIATDPQRKPE